MKKWLNKKNILIAGIASLAIAVPAYALTSVDFGSVASTWASANCKVVNPKLPQKMALCYSYLKVNELDAKFPKQAAQDFTLFDNQNIGFTTTDSIVFDANGFNNATITINCTTGTGFTTVEVSPDNLSWYTQKDYGSTCGSSDKLPIAARYYRVHSSGGNISQYTLKAMGHFSQ